MCILTRGCRIKGKKQDISDVVLIFPAKNNCNIKITGILTSYLEELSRGHARDVTVIGGHHGYNHLVAWRQQT